MLYDAYQAQVDLFAPLRSMAGLTSALFGGAQMGPAANAFCMGVSAGAEIFSRAGLNHQRPAYGIAALDADGPGLAVVEEKILDTPFGALLHFRKETNLRQPRVLIVAPMAGHFATLLRHTARAMLAEHDVYITDWKNARDVPASAGRFGMDEYIDTLVRFLDRVGPGAHAVAVCQPCAPLLATVAIMAEKQHSASPRSITLMAGPVDARVNPTEVNRLANRHSLGWFAQNVIAAVPARFAGAGRKVYPGFLQVSAFLSMNMPRHWRAHVDLYGHIVRGETGKADASRKFYDEYLAVADLPAEFYLETVETVFQEHHLARGVFEYRGVKIDPAAIRKTALLTVEGGKDDICSPGQTAAAHDLTPGIEPAWKKHYLHPDVGHYGVFSGRRWENEIYPVLRDMIAACA